MQGHVNLFSNWSEHGRTTVTHLCNDHVALDGRIDVNLDETLGLFDLHINVIVEVIHQPGTSTVLLGLLKPLGVEAQRHVGSYLEGEVYVTGFAQLPGCLKQGISGV